MADCSLDDCNKWIQQHAVLDEGILGKLQGLTVAQKQKLSELFDKWLEKIKS
jgi:hypothetical protein